MAFSHQARPLLPARSDGPEPSQLYLEQQLHSAACILQLRFGPLYEQYLEQGRTAIVMTMVAREITSPFIAAVHLGASGDMARLIGSEDDAFAILIQAALRVYSGSSPETSL